MAGMLVADGGLGRTIGLAAKHKSIAREIHEQTTTTKTAKRHNLGRQLSEHASYQSMPVIRACQLSERASYQSMPVIRACQLSERASYQSVPVIRACQLSERASYQSMPVIRACQLSEHASYPTSWQYMHKFLCTITGICASFLPLGLCARRIFPVFKPTFNPNFRIQTFTFIYRGSCYIATLRCVQMSTTKRVVFFFHFDNIGTKVVKKIAVSTRFERRFPIISQPPLFHSRL